MRQCRNHYKTEASISINITKIIIFFILLLKQAFPNVQVRIPIIAGEIAMIVQAIVLI